MELETEKRMYYNKIRYEKVEEVNLDEEVCEIMTVEQEINLWKNRADKAYDEGLAEGEKVGAEKEIQSIIEKMRANGMSEDLIAQIVG